MLLMLFALSFTSVGAQQMYENNLFGEAPVKTVFETEQQLAEYIKANKPSTFLYFERLSFSGKKRVFEHHQENTDQDITEVVLKVYRKTSRS
jgi:hypothetical protein